jgi:ElaB/YqjD/DUF883 family membrane-anchored ribosome-binding protein
MARVTPEQFQEKHARRLKASIQDIQAGIERVSVAPTAKAAKKADKMKARLVESIDSGKWQRGLMKVSLEEWKEKAVRKGIPRIADGIDSAAKKVVDFAGQLLPHIDKVKSDIDKLPDLTIEDSINRMVTFTRGMSKFKKS